MLSYIWNHRLVVVAALALLCQESFGQSEAAWRFVAGESMRYQVMQQSLISVEAGPAGRFTTDSTQTLDIVWQFDRVDDDGVAHGTQSITRLQVAVTMPEGLELKYDSEVDGSPDGVAAMLTTLYKALLETEIPFAVAPSGELVRFEPPEEMIDQLVGVPATRAMSEMVAGSGLDSIAQSIAFRVAPNSENTRAFEFSNRVLGVVSGDLQWIRTPEEGADSEIEFTPSLEVTIRTGGPTDEEDRRGPEPLANPEITSQKVDGTAVFDRQAGRLTRSALQLTLELQGEIAGQAVTSTLVQSREVRSIDSEN